MQGEIHVCRGQVLSTTDMNMKILEMLKCSRCAPSTMSSSVAHTIVQGFAFYQRGEMPVDIGYGSMHSCLQPNAPKTWKIGHTTTTRPTNHFLLKSPRQHTSRYPCVALVGVELQSGKTLATPSHAFKDEKRFEIRETC